MRRWLKNKWLWAVVAVVVVGTAVFLIPRFLETDLKTALARQLNVDGQFLHVNLPPAKGRLPGFTFVVAGSFLPLDYVERTDPTLQEGPEFTVDWSRATGSKATGMTDAGALGSLFANSRDLKVEVRATRCRSLEMRLADLKRRALASAAVLDQAARGGTTFVVVRAFEGQLEVRLTRAGQASGEVWANASKAAADLEKPSASGEAKVAVQSKSDDAIVLAWKEPVVFAYEVQRAELFTKHMGMVPDDVKFTPVAEQDLQAALAAPTSPPPTRPAATQAAAATRGTSWELATVAMGFYPGARFLQQEWNAGCADLAERALSDYRPARVHRLRATASEPLAGGAVLDFARTAAAGAKGRGATCLVLYYVGHAVTRADGEILLVQSDATPQALTHAGRVDRRAGPAGDVGDERAASASTIGSGQLDRLRELAAGLEAGSGDGGRADAVGAPAPGGLLPLRALYDALESAGLPFAVLVDGCMENDQFRSFVEGLGFRYESARPTLYYVGAAPVVFGEMSQLADRMRRFADGQPYLKGTNPVVLAAKPGTVAPSRDNPDWSGGPPVAPLALKALGAARRSAASPDPPPLPQLLRSLADFRYVGEIGLDGTISWSDFGAFDRAARRIRAGEDAAASASPAPGAVVAVHRPGVGPVKDFVCLPGGELLIIANQWDLWRWKAGGGRAATFVKGDLHFPSVAADARGAAFLHVSDDHELLPVTSAGVGPAIRERLWVAAMGPGHVGDSVIVVSGPSAVDAEEDVLRLEGGRFSTVDRLVTAWVSDVVEWERDAFYYTQEGRSEVLRRSGGVSGELCRGLAAPKLLAIAGPSLYCLNAPGDALYRIGPDGRVDRSDLLALEPAVRLERYPVTRGFRAGAGDTLLIASGDAIVQVDPARLAWRPFMPGRQ